MGWCFAKINGRLAEIYFTDDKRRKSIKEIENYCYVKKSQFKTKHEQNYIKQDTKKFRFTFRKGIFRSQIDGRELKLADMTKQREQREKDFREGNYYVWDEIKKKFVKYRKPKKITP